MMDNLNTPLKNILYVDDEEKNLSSFKSVFRKKYKIFIATSAEEGLHLLDAHPIQIVITDQRMPNMTGVEFLKKIIDRYPDIIRIILTGYSDIEAIIQAINEGKVYEYITKPWRTNELEETIERALDFYQLRQENLNLIESLRKANQELDRFVYSAAHDLRAPVASLMGLINLSKDEKDAEKLREYLQLQEKTVRKLDNFIKEIIDYSRNNRTELEADEINFENLVNEILEKFGPYKNFDKVHKKVQITQNNSFYTDINRLEIIFNNLISNAIKFSNLHQSPPFLEINVEVDTQKAIICFKDNGMGIHPTHLPKIFEMFYRATDQNVGSGLGLFLVKETLEKLEGSIEVSTAFGEGSTFTVIIPNLHNQSIE